MKTTRKWLALVASALVLSLSLAACGTKDSGQQPNTPPPTQPTAQSDPNQPKDGGTLTWSTTSDIVTLNTFYIDDTASQAVANLIYAYLYNLDASGKIVADEAALAAELPTVTNDSKTYTIKLKDTPKWNDGTPVTADDVVFTFTTYANPDAGSPSISTFDKVATVKALDKHTVQIDLKEVYAPFELAALNVQMLPNHVLKDVPPAELQKHAFGTDPAKTVSNGPYKWTNWTQKQSLTFDRDASYWGKKAHIQTIVYKVYADQNTETQALVKGEVDLVEQIPVASLAITQGKDNLQLIEGAGPVYDYLGFNFLPENWPGNFVPFAGMKTRQAIAHALNRQGMVDSVLKGHGTLLNGPFLPKSWSDAGTAVNYEYSIEKAKKLLEEDGWKPGADGILEKDGHKFEFGLQYNTGNKRRESVAAVIQANLKDVGIKVNIEPLDFSAWIENHVVPGKYQSLLLGWQLNVDPDAESIFSSKYFPPNGQNSGWYKNEKVDKLWVDGYLNTDLNKRREIYGELAKEISTDLPYVFLYQQNIIMGVSRRVKFAEEDKPIVALPYGTARHIQYWWLDDAK